MTYETFLDALDDLVENLGKLRCKEDPDTVTLMKGQKSALTLVQSATMLCHYASGTWAGYLKEGITALRRTAKALADAYRWSGSYSHYKLHLKDAYLDAARVADTLHCYQ